MGTGVMSTGVMRTGLMRTGVMGIGVMRTGVMGTGVTGTSALTNVLHLAGLCTCEVERLMSSEIWSVAIGRSQEPWSRGNPRNRLCDEDGTRYSILCILLGWLDDTWRRFGGLCLSSVDVFEEYECLVLGVMVVRRRPTASRKFSHNVHIDL